MSHHTGTSGACQLSAAPGATLCHQTIPYDTREGAGTVDRRLAQRFGVPLLSGGYTALPTLAYLYYARLGVTEAEFVFIGQLCTYWWSTRDPYPGEEALAARMGKSKRTIQGYIRSLAGKGLLHIHTRHSPTGQQHSNAYDLRPFFQAVAGLARLDGRLPDTGAGATAATGHAVPHERARQASLSDTEACPVGTRCHNDTRSHGGARQSLCAGAAGSACEGELDEARWSVTDEGEEGHAEGVQEFSPQVDPIEVDPFDSDAIPPTPTDTAQRPAAPGVRPATATAPWKKGHTGHRDRAEWNALSGATPHFPGSRAPAVMVYGDRRDVQRPVNMSDHAASQRVPEETLVATIRALGDELGDDAPASSGARASNLYRHAGIPLDQFLRLVHEAAARTRARQDTIVKRQRDGQATNGMPYLFAVLQDLLHPAPSRPADVSLDRRRGERPRRRHRQRHDGRAAAANGDAAGSDSPAPVPLVEAHPVWRAALAELAQVMTAENFNVWLATTRALGQEGEVLRVAVPTPFNQTWLAHKLAAKVLGALHTIDYEARGLARVGRVEYVVDAAACAPSAATAQAS